MQVRYPEERNNIQECLRDLGSIETQNTVFLDPNSAWTLARCASYLFDSALPDPLSAIGMSLSDESEATLAKEISHLLDIVISRVNGGLQNPVECYAQPEWPQIVSTSKRLVELMSKNDHSRSGEQGD